MEQRRPAALFVTPEAPYPAAGGGALRAACLLEYLGRRYDVDVIAFREPGAPDPGRLIPAGVARHVRTINLPPHSRHFLARAVRNAGRLARGAPPLNDRFAGFGNAIGRYLEGRRYALALIEHFWCAPYWEDVAPHSARVVLDLHNLESALLAACARSEPWPANLAFLRFEKACRALERRWLPKFHVLLTPSPSDARLIREIAPGSEIHVCPNAIPAISPPARREDGDIVAFSGNLGYQPNISAVRFFRRAVWPILRERRPGVVWRLIGRNPEDILKYVSGDSRIEVVGAVENAIEALAAAKVAVVPLLAGSGTRVKILEAWAAGTPVVSTAIGAEGLPVRHGEHLLLADTPEDFAGAILSLLESEKMRRDLGNVGRRLYVKEFTWEAAWDALGKIGI